MAFPTEQEIRDVVAPLAAATGLDVEGVKITRAGKKSAVRIALDGDRRPDLDLLETVSQAVSGEFDAREESGAMNFGAGYTLELTTPGLDTPLTEPRHFRRNIGRLVSIAPVTPGASADAAATGKKKKSAPEKLRVAGTDGETVWLVRPAANRRADPTVEARGLADAAGALVEVEFSEPPAAEADLVGLDPEKYRALTAQEENK
ncbi:ribosome maturation factor RimP [Corynebacterium nuruki]|uniref:ribosome maturation factor RimP n=1 Tax=Corynebacterium nuruki TaxID=1032851 RepID=UPI0039BFE01B